MSEWLKSKIWNFMGYARVGSNPTDVVSYLLFCRMSTVGCASHLYWKTQAMRRSSVRIRDSALFFPCFFHCRVTIINQCFEFFIGHIKFYKITTKVSKSTSIHSQSVTLLVSSSLFYPKTNSIVHSPFSSNLTHDHEGTTIFSHALISTEFARLTF